MDLKATIKAEISKLHTLRYVNEGNGYTAVLRDASVDPHIDQVVENIITIYARYHLEQGVKE